MKRLLTYSLLVACISLSSCVWLFNKAKRARHDLWPTYHADKADSWQNIENLKRHLQIAYTTDIDSIICSADRIGLDHSFKFTFTCHDSTLLRIRQQNALTFDSAPMKNASKLGSVQSWWPANNLDTMNVFTNRTTAEKIQRYLWHIPGEQRVYYLEFDL